MNTVIGSTGLIGRAVWKELKHQGLPCLGFSRNRLDQADQILHLQERDSWKNLPCGSGTVLLAAPSFSLRDCRLRPAETQAMQVRAVVDLAKFSSQRGLFPILLSSSFVYDASRPDFGPQDPTHPACEYGRQKAEMETRVLEALPECSVVRLTKVFGGDHPLVSSWWETLRSGGQIEAAGDARLSPLRSQWVAEALVHFMKHPRAGIWHLSAFDDISWSELAMKVADASLARAGRVSTRSLRDIDPSAEFVPRYGTLKPCWPYALSIPASSVAVKHLVDNLTASNSNPDQNLLKLKS